MIVKTVYVVHHSHTDIGYTDYQERIAFLQTDYIRTVLNIMRRPENAAFRWNCETLWCVERFLNACGEKERDAFFRLAAEGKIGLSANYLNFTDLVDDTVLSVKLRRLQRLFTDNGAPIKTAMTADINGISMGVRDALIENGVEFLFMNVHADHGMYPLWKNQTAFRWESRNGGSLLVWNGAHYHLGNFLGLKPENPIRSEKELYEAVETLHRQLSSYLDECERNGCFRDFILMGVSGIWTDNAPPNAEILRVIEAYNSRYGHTDAELKMVSLQELYAAVAPKLKDVPVCRGDFTDWWANGVGSTPYAVKHYKDAVRRCHLCEKLDRSLAVHYPGLYQKAQDNLLLYAEHTWGHSASVSDPFNTMVNDLDLRKSAYASQANEAATEMLYRIARADGDLLRYFSDNGTIRVLNTAKASGAQVVAFYTENRSEHFDVYGENGVKIPSQTANHPRGKRIVFIDSFNAGEEKTYTYRAAREQSAENGSRTKPNGSAKYENEFFKLVYRPQAGVTSFIDKTTGDELLGEGEAPFFTPLYEVTPVTVDTRMRQREKLELNIRGTDARLYKGELENVIMEETGAVYDTLRLCFRLPGTTKADVHITFYHAIPRIDFKLQLAKTQSEDVESIFLPLTLNYPNRKLAARKGHTEAFLPGYQQLPGSCMEFTMSDDGIAFLKDNGSALICSYDTPLFYMGEMKNHTIRLCTQEPADNLRPVYAWIMNNMWETNFKLSLAGYAEFRYSLILSDAAQADEAMDLLHERSFAPVVRIIKQG